ncbi:hypothetical protein BDR26DRAFT_691619 [Obelidium mucronatum]|nr:hypothetical protein BDR26DRAFT_691619 [Obelidium mucronatum]
MRLLFLGGLMIGVFEINFRFVKEPIDAAILAEAASIDLVPLNQACDVHVRSGSVFIMTVDDALKWNDGMMWSPAKAVGRFTLSRQVEQMQCGHVENSLMHDQSNSEVSLAQGTQLVENGLYKRSITVKSTKGYRFHIVSYFNPVDILHLYTHSPENDISTNNAEMLKPPSTMPQFQDILKNLIRLIYSTRHTPELIALPPSVIPFEDSTDGDTDYDSDDNPISPLLLPSSFIAV